MDTHRTAAVAPRSDAPDDPVSKIELEVATLLRFAAGSFRAEEAVGSLDRSAYLILDVLLDQGSASVNAIARRLLLNASTITRQLDAMAAAGLVTRSRHPDDGRVTLVAASDSGREAFRQNRRTRHRFYEAVTARWPGRDRARLAELLARLNADLDAAARSR